MQRKEDTSVLESRLRVELERQYYELKAKYSHDVCLKFQFSARTTLIPF